MIKIKVALGICLVSFTLGCGSYRLVPNEIPPYTTSEKWDLIPFSVAESSTDLSSFRFKRSDWSALDPPPVKLHLIGYTEFNINQGFLFFLGVATFGVLPSYFSVDMQGRLEVQISSKYGDDIYSTTIGPINYQGKQWVSLFTPLGLIPGLITDYKIAPLGGDVIVPITIEALATSLEHHLVESLTSAECIEAITDYGFYLRVYPTLSEGDYYASIREATSIVRGEPINSRVYLLRGWAYYHLGKLENAEEDANTALRTNQGSKEAHALLYRIAVDKGQLANAQQNLRRKLLDPGFMGDDQKLSLLFRFYLGEVPLEQLKSRDDWRYFEVPVRGYIKQQLATGSLVVNIQPAEAVAAGAQYRVGEKEFSHSGVTTSELQAGEHVVSFRPIQGWRQPNPATVNVSAGKTITLSVSYVPAPSSQPSVLPPLAQRWAVIIGVSEYEHAGTGGLQNLRYAHRDAEKLYERLVSGDPAHWHRQNVKLLTNEEATERNVRLAITEFLKKAQSDDMVMIFFSGHGSPDPDRPQNNYFLCHDTDPTRLAATGFPMWEIENALERDIIKAQRVIVLADACHSGGFAPEGMKDLNIVSRTVTQAVQEFARRPHTRVVTSALPGQLSRENADWGGGHGAFTYALLEGLTGAADSLEDKNSRGNGDGKVELDELVHYIRRRVGDLTKNAQQVDDTGRLNEVVKEIRR